MTIEEAKLDKKKLESAIHVVVSAFEKKYGNGTVAAVALQRWNGSTGISGPISAVHVGVSILNGDPPTPEV